MTISLSIIKEDYYQNFFILNNLNSKFSIIREIKFIYFTITYVAKICCRNFNYILFF